ncbi:hypothetical protein JVU11DRAFT_1237 [Chiua virens]|nr:hypothetical protein JVU11DRAFT_1237 [Chiua virens]
MLIKFDVSKLEHAFTLYHEGKVFVQEAVKDLVGKKKVTLLKTLNKATRILSKQDQLFSHANWGRPTDNYTSLLIKKGPKNTAEIIQTALDMLGHTPEISKGSRGSDAVNLRTLLW